MGFLGIVVTSVSEPAALRRALSDLPLNLLSAKLSLKLLLYQTIFNLLSAIAMGELSPNIDSGEYFENMLEGI
jgi:hypothetical protein